MKKAVVFSVGLFMSALMADAQTRDDWIPILEPSPAGGLVHTGEFTYQKNYTGGIWEKSGPPTAIVIQNGRQSPVVTQKGLGFLNRQYGGSGEIQIVLERDTPSHNPIDLEAMGEALPPIELFEDDGSPAMQPQNGLWTSSLDIVSEEGCPPGVADAAASALGMSVSKQIVFSNPTWRPGDFGPQFAEMDWQKVGENALIATPYLSPNSDPQSGMSIVVQFQMKLFSDTKVEVRGRVLVAFSEAMAAIVGSSKECRVVARGFYTRN